MSESTRGDCCDRCGADLIVARLGRARSTVGLERSARRDPDGIPIAKGRYAYPSQYSGPNTDEVFSGAVVMCGGCWQLSGGFWALAKGRPWSRGPWQAKTMTLMASPLPPDVPVATCSSDKPVGWIAPYGSKGAGIISLTLWRDGSYRELSEELRHLKVSARPKGERSQTAWLYEFGTGDRGDPVCSWLMPLEDFLAWTNGSSGPPTEVILVDEDRRAELRARWSLPEEPTERGA